MFLGSFYQFFGANSQDRRWDRDHVARGVDELRRPFAATLEKRARCRCLEGPQTIAAYITNGSPTVGQNGHPIAGSRRSMKSGPPGRDPALAALEARLGWPAVMAEGCRWIIGEPGNGAWEWCGAPCIVSGAAGSAAWCADHWRSVYMIGGNGDYPDERSPEAWREASAE